MIPRLVLGAGLANSAAHWTALAIDLNNAACADFLRVNSGSLSDLLAGFPIFDHTWLLAVLLVAFLLVWLRKMSTPLRQIGGAVTVLARPPRVC